MNRVGCSGGFFAKLWEDTGYDFFGWLVVQRLNLFIGELFAGAFGADGELLRLERGCFCVEIGG